MRECPVTAFGAVSELKLGMYDVFRALWKTLLDCLGNCSRDARVYIHLLTLVSHPSFDHILGSPIATHQRVIGNPMQMLHDC